MFSKRGLQILLIFVILSVSLTSSVKKKTKTKKSKENTRKFSDNFKFGVGSSSYQVEGAWNLHNKGESVWDRATHTPGHIEDGSTGDITCDAYHKYKEDISLLKKLKVDSYRFSLSWPRLFPTGTVNYLNPDGVKYYNNLINGLLENGIKPMVTLFHWETPQVLQDLGGWTNDQMVVWFEAYADKVFSLFGNRVKIWSTLNEPANYCAVGYAGGTAPYINNSGIGSYLCTHNMIRAHAKVYRLYQRKYKKLYNGKIGISLDCYWYEPKNANSKSDQEAVKVSMDFHFGWYANPIFKTGDYPNSMKTRIARRSYEQGFNDSRLPKFTESEKKEILGSADYLGLNHYFTILATFAYLPTSKIPSFFNDRDTLPTLDPNWKTTTRPIFTVVPRSLYKSLIWLRKDLGPNVKIAITENGYNGYQNETLDDQDRIDYINDYLDAVLDAVHDGVNVTDYTFWSFMDSFEWGSGFTPKFGLYKVDFNNPDRPRTAKKSAMVYQNIIVTRKIDPTFDPVKFAH